jgi:hypothetical protein
MNENDAFELLGIPLKASEDLINSRFRELAALNHPDKGGDNHSMKELLFARDRALEAVRRRSHEPVDVLGEVVRINTEVSTRMEQREITKKILSDLIQEHTRLYEKIKAKAVILGLLSGLGALVGTRLIILFEIPWGLTNLFAALAVLSGFIYLFSSSSSAELKRMLEETNEILDNKSFYLGLLHVINLTPLETQPWTKQQLESCIGNWLGVKSNELSGLRKLALKIGVTDFSGLLLSKGIELGIIKEEEIIEEGRGLVKYTFKGTR